MKRVIFAICVLVAASLACSLLSPTVSPTSNPPVQIQPTSNQAQPTVQVPPQSNVLFQDDFSSTSSGWDQVDQSEKVTDYVNGGYRMWLTTVNYDIWANPNNNTFSGPVSVEVDATLIAGPENNDFGIQCHYQDVSNFYVGLISSDGYDRQGPGWHFHLPVV
jgi:hypothetical protein